MENDLLVKRNDTKQLASVVGSKRFPIPEVIRVLRKYPHLRNYQSFISRSDIRAYDILKVLSDTPSLNFIGSVRNHKLVEKYLRSVDHKELVFLRKNINSEKVWEIIVSHIPANMAYSEAKRLNSDGVWISYLLRYDVADTDTVKIASKINKKVFLSALRKKSISIEYLEELSLNFIGFGGVRHNITAIISERQHS